MAAASPLVDLLKGANSPDASVQAAEDFNDFLEARLSVRAVLLSDLVDVSLTSCDSYSLDYEPPSWHDGHGLAGCRWCC